VGPNPNKEVFVKLMPQSALGKVALVVVVAVLGIAAIVIVLAALGAIAREHDRPRPFDEP